MSGLFDSIEIRGLKIKNRLVMPPMATKMATKDGEVTDRHIKHYGARAKGGVGLIILEHTYVSANGKMSDGQLGIYDDKLLDGLRRLVQAIHREGARVGIQLTHSGSRTTREIIKEQPAGPWNIPVPGDEEVPRPFTIEEIKNIVTAFSAAARRAVEAGFDIVELHGAHGYLLSQFLSPYTNRRQDEYGGNWEGRLHLPLETISEVRGRIGEDTPLFYRFGADDMLEGGLTGNEAKLIAPRLEQSGVDVIDISGGLGGSGRDRFTEQGYFVPLARAIKDTVEIPVIGVGNITDAHYANTIVEQDMVDMVAFGRLLLSEPEYPKQAAHELGVKAF
ncbi:MAG: NADH:flavin oxidoreductase [Dehalococcoidales bacterium]|nr:NADH:flavin oxidoreductase [Dehalococcoidales bacterium]